MSIRLFIIGSLLLAAISTLCAPSIAGPGSATISNVQPRRDTDGKIVDAHDGCLMYFDGVYYLYGTRYAATDGFGVTNRYVCYSSPDLVTWTFHGEMLRDAPNRVYYRPYVIYNKATREYVMWYNADNDYGVAVSNSPTGPFDIVNPNVQVKYASRSVGDLGLFVDNDGTAYLPYSSGPGGLSHQICVERLTPDYLGSTGQASEFVAGNCEAPALFRRKNTYYLLFDNTSCFGVTGSGARVYTSTAPLGPYTYRGNVNVKSASARNVPITQTQPGAGRPNTIIKAQQTFVATLPTSHGPVYIWMGDEWGSRPDGVKGHDYQYWSRPLAFERDGMIKQLTWDPDIGDRNFILPRHHRGPIVVESAAYGDLSDPSRTVDVTADIQRIVDAGSTGFPVSVVVLMASDPDYGVVKTLTVRYRLNGQELAASALDGQTIELSAR